MTEWIKSGVMAWLSESPYIDDETVLVYFKGTGLTAMAEGLSALHRPPFAHGGDPAPGDWGVIVHHGPKAYHHKDGRTASCIDYEDPDYVGEHWPNAFAPLITAAELDHDRDDYEPRLTRLIGDQLGLPALNRATMVVDQDLVAAYF
ncbi:hypothetical protein [Streptomyces sp. SAI-170]|uniref:hypothetical protein n=1 Tax=Streptomyces sp. SAI-170 TaxID=3377729 RepID=UPI003C7AA042